MPAAIADASGLLDSLRDLRPNTHVIAMSDGLDAAYRDLCRVLGETA